MTTAPRPPAVAGVPAARVTDCVRLVWWAQRGYRHGARYGRPRGRALSAALATAWWPCLPLLVVVQAVMLARPRARYYLSPGRDAVLAVVATRRGWVVEDHATACPGTGQGRGLRAIVLPQLLAAADTHQVSIHTSTATTALAVAYQAEVPGLVDVGAGHIRGRRLRRDPVSSPRGYAANSDVVLDA